MKLTDILKAIQKLNPAEKHRLRELLIDKLTASSSTGAVLEEISERKKTKVAINVLIVNQSILFDLESIQPLSMVKKLKSSVIAVRLVKGRLQT